MYELQYICSNLFFFSAMTSLEKEWFWCM